MITAEIFVYAYCFAVVVAFLVVVDPFEGHI